MSDWALFFLVVLPVLIVGAAICLVPIAMPINERMGCPRSQGEGHA